MTRAESLRDATRRDETLAVTVVVLTYRRPIELSRALPTIVAQARELGRDAGIATSVLVVDNDPVGSAREVVQAFDPLIVRYLVEPKPGIAAGRNRGLSEAQTPGLVVYIDDDEAPMDGWLRPLVDTWRSTGATAVMGRVISQFEGEPDPWIAAGAFFWRPTRKTGTEIRVAAAGNLLIDLEQVRMLGLAFDDRFGLSGGEDTLFSRQLVQRGGRIVWCDESRAVDFVPASRANREWVLGRSRRTGNTTSSIDIQLAGSRCARFAARCAAVGGGMARMTGGAVRYLGGLAIRSLWHQARGLRTANRGIGMVVAALGINYQEYARND